MNNRPKEEPLLTPPDAEQHTVEQILYRPFITFLLLLCIGFTVYSGLGSYEFAKDDQYSVLPVKGLDKLSSIPRYFTSPIEFLDPYLGEMKPLHYYRPLDKTTQTIDFFILGKENPGLMHVENLLWHIVNSFLFFLIVTALTKNKRIAFLSSVLYLTFPHSAEIVCIYHYRVDILVTFFIFLSLLCTLTIKDKRWILWASLFFFLGMLSKENAITLLLLIPLFRWYQYREFQLRNLLLWLGLPCLLYWGLRYNALGALISQKGALQLDYFASPVVTGTDKVFSILHALGERFFWIIAPYRIPPNVIGIFHPPFPFSGPGMVILLAFIAGSLRFLKKQNLTGLCSIWFLTAWFLLSSLLVPVPDYAAARFFFHFAPALSLLFILLIFRIPSPLIRYICLIILLANFALGTAYQKLWYKNDLSMPLGAMVFYPDIPQFQIFAGTQYIYRGSPQKAIQYLNRGMELLDKHYGDIKTAAQQKEYLTHMALHYLAEAYVKTGKIKKAIYVSDIAIRFFPNHFLAYMQGIDLRLKHKDYQGAQRLIEQGRERKIKRQDILDKLEKHLRETHHWDEHLNNTEKTGQKREAQQEKKSNTTGAKPALPVSHPSSAL